MKALKHLPRLTILLAFSVICACSDGGDSRVDLTLGVPGAGNPNQQSVNPATVEGPIEGAPTLVGTIINLPPLGYTVETEYFLSGTANTYINVNELASDGKWRVEASEQADYKTRIVVIRPEDPGDFNGTVFVEWLNVSAGFDSSPQWLMSHTEMIRSGFAWVGVSAQRAGIDALQDGSACDINPLCDQGEDRYDSLDHPGDNYAYDIYSQVAQAIRNPGDASPLGNLRVRHLIAGGESQSARRLTTYVNAFAPLHALFDGYLIHSRTQGSAGLQEETFCEVAIPTPEIVRVRDDLGVPTMMVQTETDLFILGSYPSNQPDSRNFRLWEIAGTAHADLYTFIEGRLDVGTNTAVAAVEEVQVPINQPPAVIDCSPFPVNDGPQHFVVNAAIRALNTWIVEGEAPAKADRLEVTGEPPAFAKDEYGNTKGGVRTPYVDVPIAVLEGEGQPQNDLSEIGETCEIDLENTNFCFLSGTTDLFGANRLAFLYESNAAYIEKVNAAADESVAKGFLLPEDAQLIRDWVASSDIFAPE